MCLIVFAYDIDPRYRLIVAANRDEFYARPSAAADWWTSPEILAGRDLQRGGSWLGIDRSGRLAAVTNVRNRRDLASSGHSRGALIPAFLGGTSAAVDFAHGIDGDRYPGFNLLLFDGRTLHWSSNRSAPLESLPAGLYALSNAALDTPWPKVRRAKTLLGEALTSGRVTPESLLQLLADEHQPDDAELPDTGVGLAWERTLAPIFIQSPEYGTRSSTVILYGRDGHVQFVERSGPAEQPPRTDCKFQIRLPDI